MDLLSVFLLFWAFRPSSSSSQKNTYKKDSRGRPVPKSELRQRFRQAVEVAKLGDEWLRFLECTARRESNFRPGAWNKTPRERARSRQLAEKRRDKLAAIGYSVDDWSFGSRGLFQFLGAVACLDNGPDGSGDPDPAYRFSPEFIESVGGPRMAYDSGVSVAIALDFARGLMRRGAFQGSWASLDAGWGLPKKIGDPVRIAKKVRSMTARGEQLGWDPGWAMDPVTPLPAFTQHELEAIAKAASFAYGGEGVA